MVMGETLKIQHPKNITHKGIEILNKTKDERRHRIYKEKDRAMKPWQGPKIWVILLVGLAIMYVNHVF